MSKRPDSKRRAWSRLRIADKALSVVLIFAIAIALFLDVGGVSWIASSLDYTKGTEALDRHDYQSAVRYLERSVSLDPFNVRNRTNLAAAYASVGDYEKAWREDRKAILLDHNAPHVMPNFFSAWHAFENLGAISIGNSATEIAKALGAPDLLVAKGNKEYWSYGIMLLVFDDKILAHVIRISFSDRYWDLIQLNALSHWTPLD